MINSKPINRRTLFRRGATAGLAVSTTTLGLARTAGAAGAPKNSVQYQPEPKTLQDGTEQKCTGCRFFEAPDGDADMGACSLVKGKIHPNGWCALYAPAA